MLQPYVPMPDRSNEDVTGYGLQQAKEFNAVFDSQRQAWAEAGQQLSPELIASDYEKNRQAFSHWLNNQGFNQTQRQQIEAEFNANAYNPYERSWGEVVTDTAKQVGSGAANLAGSALSGLGMDEAADSLWQTADELNQDQSTSIQLQSAAAEQQYQADVASGMNSALAAAKMYKDNPRLIGKLAAEQLPQLGLAAIPMVGGTALVGTNVLAGGGNVRKAVREAWENMPYEDALNHPLMQERLKQGMSFPQALEDVKNDYSDNALNILFGYAIGGAEAATPLAKLGKGINKSVTGTIAKEIGVNALQGGAEQVNQNLAVRSVDGKTNWNDDLGRSMVEEGIGGAAFSPIAAADAYRNGKAEQINGTQSEQSLNTDEQEIQRAGGGESDNEQVTEAMAPMAERQFAQPQQAVQNPQQNTNSAFDETAFNKAIESVAEYDRDIFKARLERDIANGNLANRTGNGKYDRFVRDYLALNQVPEVVRQAEQQTEQGVVTPEIQQPNTAIQGGQAQIQLGSQGSQMAQYELVEADELAVNLKPNAYQNRDRTSADSQAQIMEYAANLNPSYLSASVDVTQGAPTVDGNYGVFAGNGRLAAIKQAYAKNPQNATAYRDYLAQNAPQFGFTAEQVQGMKQPVLVRKVAGNIDLKKAVEEGNFNTGLDKGVIGNAKANADYISDELLDLVEINDDGSLNLSESNTPFISSLVSRIPVEQRPQFFAEKKLGNQTAYTLTAQGRELVENALLVKAYSDGSNYAENLLTDLITGTEDGNKRVKAALTAIAGKVIQTKGTEYDISADLVQAYDLMSKGKKAGLNATEAANQGDLLNPPNETVQGLVGLFYSPKSISEVQQPLNAYLDKVIGSKLHQTEQGGMFDDENPSRKELLNQAGMKASRSAMKSVEANIKRGKQAMNTAITEHRTVHRAMFNHELGGWVDFEWGDDGLTKPFNKKGEPVGKGIAHIIEARQRKDGMSYQDVVRMLTNNVVETIAKGEVAGHWVRNNGKSESIQLDYNGYRAGLIKNKGSNAWLLTAFELYPTGANSAGSVDTERATQSKPTLTRQGMGAVGSQNVRSSVQDVNSSPEIQQAKTILEKALGKAYADQVNFVRSSDFNDGRATAEGFFQNGKVHIVLDNIYSNDTMNRAERMAWVAWHEFAHNGVDVRFKGNYDAMIKMARSHPVVNVITRRIKAEYETAVANGELDKMPNENTLVEEALVELYAATKTGNWAEIESRYNTKVHRSWKASDSSLMALFERIANAMRRMVGRIIGKDLRQTTNDEIFAILKGIDQGVQSLAENSENQTASGDTRYSLNEREDSAFAKAVDEVVNGRVRGKFVQMGTTPDVLKMLGLPDTNISINDEVIEKAMAKQLDSTVVAHKHPHNLTARDLKRLPTQLNNPIAVMKSSANSTNPNGFVILTEIVELKNGVEQPVIAALNVKQTTKGLEVVNISSVHGRPISQIKRFLTDDLLYWNKEKGYPFADSVGLHLPRRFSADNLSARNVKTEQDLSQYQAENSVRYSRQPQDLSETAYNQAKAEGKTELTFQQWKQVRSPEFKLWFGDWENDHENASKIINQRTGEPLVVYHGSNADFNIFDRNKIKVDNLGNGFYFTDVQEIADSYATRRTEERGGKENRKAVFLNVRTPLDTDNISAETARSYQRKDFESVGILTADEIEIELNNILDEADGDYNWLVNDLSGSDNLAWLQENGFDGIKVEGSDKRTGKKGTAYVAFNSNQIKSATDNNGEFSAENDDIRYSRRPKSESLEKLRKAETIRITGKEIEPSDDLKQYRKNAFDYGKKLRKQSPFVNRDTGKEINLQRASLTEILTHDYKNPEHLQSVAAIPQIAENAIYIDTLPNEDTKRPDIEQFDYYLAGLNIGGKDYTVRMSVGESDFGELYYDHKLTPIEKGRLLEARHSDNNSGVPQQQSAFDGVNDKRLLQILQDENAENTPRYSRKQSAMETANAKQVNQHPNVLERVKNGGFAQFKKEVEKARAFIDTKMHDRLRPVMDWIDGIEVQGLSAYEKSQLKDSIYAAEGIKADIIVQAELKYLNPIRDDIAAIAKKYFNGDGETALKKAGFWISTRWAIEKNAQMLKADYDAMIDAEQEYNDSVANGEPMDVQDRLERAFIKAENQYYNRKADVESRDFSDDRKYKVGTAGGWSMPLAKAIMAKMESQIPRAELEALAEKVYDLNAWKLDQDLESGRFTAEEVKRFKQDRHYVPLTGDPSMELDDVLRMPSNRNPNVAKDKGLQGRKLSEADDAISTIWESVAKTATYNGWQPMKAHFAKLYDQAYQEAISNGSSKKAAADEATNKTGISKQKMQGLTRTSDNVLIYKENGNYYELSLPEKAMEQIKKQNSDNTPALLRPVQAATGWLARSVTQFKPHFAIVNMVRDLWEKSEFVRTKEIFDKNGNPLPEEVKNQIGREMWKQAMGAIAGQNRDVWKAAKRYAMKQGLRDNVPAERELKILLKNGGVSTHSTLLERKETDLIKTINRRNSTLAKGIEKAILAVEIYNGIFDIISSIAANRALLKYGVDPKHASAVTLDLTNFRKQGDWMPFIKSFYMFAQPTAVGGANLIKMMGTKTGRKRLLQGALFYGTLSFILRSIADEDEDGNAFAKEGDKDRFIPIPIGEYNFKLPVGYGAPQLMWNMGYNITEAIMGDKTWGDAAASTMLHAFKAVAPVSPSEVPVSEYPGTKALMTLTPTIAQPIVQNIVNRNAFGSQLASSYINDKSLKAEQGKMNTAPSWTGAALWLNDTFGMDFAPEHVKNFIQGYANMVPLMNEALTILVENPNKARLGKPESVPFINALVGPKNPYATQSQFYRFRDEANDTVKNFNSRKERGTLPESWNTNPEIRWQRNWFAKAEEMEKTQRKVKSNLTKLHNEGKLSTEAYQHRLNNLAKDTEAKQRKLVGMWRFHNGLNTSKPLN